MPFPGGHLSLCQFSSTWILKKYPFPTLYIWPNNFDHWILIHYIFLFVLLKQTFYIGVMYFVSLDLIYLLMTSKPVLSCNELLRWYFRQSLRFRLIFLLIFFLSSMGYHLDSLFVLRYAFLNRVFQWCFRLILKIINTFCLIIPCCVFR